MALAELLNLTSSTTEFDDSNNGLITEERIGAAMPTIRKYISFFREYPDIFVDFLCGENKEHFSLFFYQRVFLRAAMR